MHLRYEKVADCHRALRAGDPPLIRSRGKSRCAGSIDLARAQAWLEDGLRKGLAWPPGEGDPRHVFARHEGVWYQANRHAPGRYHGFPVPDERVPPRVRRRFRED